MKYFTILNLTREPFSNSPDPEYFFQSRQHLGCIQKLELSLRLRRGLNVVLGDVGTGKTTLCRQLIRRFATDEEYETHLILDPQFSGPAEFLSTVAEMFAGRLTADLTNDWQFKEIIKKYIFGRGVDEKKKVVLIIDEGQKLPEFCLEILREFLNYETNEFKLLQIVIFAQKEFEKTLEVHANFADRISLYHILGPMNFRDTRMMIKFRLEQSSEKSKTPALFSYPALWAIHRSTGGYPRKIINLCHQCILAMIIQNKTKVGWFIVRSCGKRTFFVPSTAWRQVAIAALVGFALVLLTSVLAPQGYKKLIARQPEGIKSASIPVASARFDASENLRPAESVTPQAAADPAINENTSEPLPKIDLNQSVGRAEKTIGRLTAEAVTEMPPLENRLPVMLGQVALKRNETLWRLVEKVYGVFDPRHLAFLLQANSRIKNPDEVEIKQLIAVPAIPATLKPLPMKVWWVQLDEKNKLEAAINFLRAYPDDVPPVRIIPYWDRLLGLKFAILSRGCFFDEISAKNQLNALPSELTINGRIVAEWDKDTVFYADPYRVLQ